jgi:D-alanyl-D-alanine carboxypeptidase (penicillin-binding protein 5/6)
VVDLTTRRVLAEREPFAPHPPASTLKVLTALTLSGEHDPGDRIEVSQAAALTEGSRVGLYGDQDYEFEDLLEALLMVSANDAAAALAEDDPGLVAHMQSRADQLGMRATEVRNPHGLYDPAQVTSAYDLALAFSAALEDPVLGPVLGQSRAPFTRHDGAVVELFTHGSFTGVYPGALGGKTGYTIDSGSSFVGAAERDGHVLVVGMLRTEPKVGPQAAALLDWGFANLGADVRDFTSGVNGPALRAAFLASAPEVPRTLAPASTKVAQGDAVLGPVLEPSRGPLVLALLAFVTAPAAALLALARARKR